MASMMVKVLCVVVACMIVSVSFTEAITCGQVASKLAPCINYLKSGGAVPGGCCSGVKGLNSLAKTPADRKTICGCIKSLSSSSSSIKPSLAAGLPGKCGVSIPYKISPSTDCTKVQ